MMKFFYVAILIILNCLIIEGQTIPNHNFNWDIIENCGSSQTCTEVFLKAETDPIINKLKKEEFESQIENTINNMKLEESVSGTLKLKLLFIKGKPLCLSEAGYSGLEIAHEKLTTLSKRFNLIDQITHGTMRNKPVNTQGYLYINIKNGKLESIRNVNFSLRDKSEQ